jgi:prepilin-type N-terminal cleavage/methylation domain-containing protein
VATRSKRTGSLPIPAFRRRAFSLIELLTVISIIGLVFAVAAPRVSRLRDQGEMSSAMSRFTRAVMATRQSAIQRGRNAYFKHNNNSIWVILDTTGTNSDSVIVTAELDLKSLHNVEITAPTGLTSIVYDPRGVSSQASKQVFHFKHRNNLQDSLCISKLGNTIREKCP